MRIIDYYNYIATAAYIFIGVAAVIIFRKRAGADNSEDKDLSGKMTKTLLAMIMIVAAFMRLYLLGIVPNGLQQDEASIGYEAYALAEYGVDRNGYAYPVHPLAFGSGGNSELMIYLNMISVKLFGTGVVKLRLLPAILGIITVFIFFFVLKELFSAKKYDNYRNLLSIIGTAFLAVCPWHVILSRWSLDSNIMPFLQIVATYAFLVALRKKGTINYVLSAILFAVCMYGYGAGVVIIPIFIVFSCAYALYKKEITFRQLVYSGVSFLIVFFPLLLFYAVNYLGLPEIVTEHFSINKLTATRSGEVFMTLDSSLPARLFNNIKVLMLTLTIGNSDDMPCHFYPGYATLFEFTFPITFIGLFLIIRDFIKGLNDKNSSESEYYSKNAAIVAYIIGNVLMAVFLETDISRMVTLFIPLIYAFIKGLCFIYENSRRLSAVVMAFVLFATISFAKDYFTDFNSNVISIFMPDYGNAIARAYEIAGDDREIYSTYYGLSTPFVIALYYTDYDPVKFNETVEYIDDKAMFRAARSFANFVFDDLPENVLDDKYQDTVFVVSSSELDLFGNSQDHIIEKMGAYCVVYTK